MDKKEILDNATLRGAGLSGVYYLLCPQFASDNDGDLYEIEKQIIYIGKSKNMPKRILTHMAERKKVFSHFHMRPSPIEEMSMLEVEEIIKYQPYFNINLPSNPIWKRKKTISNIFGLSNFDMFIHENEIKGVKVGETLYYNINDFKRSEEEQCQPGENHT